MTPESPSSTSFGVTPFGARSTPVVLLSRIPLEVLSFSDQQIVARLPVDVPSAYLVSGGKKSRPQDPALASF